MLSITGCRCVVETRNMERRIEQYFDLVYGQTEKFRSVRKELILTLSQGVSSQQKEEEIMNRISSYLQGANPSSPSAKNSVIEKVNRFIQSLHFINKKDAEGPIERMAESLPEEMKIAQYLTVFLCGSLNKTASPESTIKVLSQYFAGLEINPDELEEEIKGVLRAHGLFDELKVAPYFTRALIRCAIDFSSAD